MNCIQWKGYKNACGYGVYPSHRKNQLAHRVIWRILNGIIPKGLCILHRCDNPSCINPKHLFLGTQTDNMRDASKKKRFDTKGEKNGRAILTKRKVKQIKKLLKEGGKVYQIARKYNVNWSVIENIKLKRRWRHL